VEGEEERKRDWRCWGSWPDVREFVVGGVPVQLPKFHNFDSIESILLVLN
jgi:hypothetical protein